MLSLKNRIRIEANIVYHKNSFPIVDIVGVSSPKADRNVNQNDSSAHSLDLDTNRGVSQQDIDSLKQIAVSVLSESLFKRILEINQVKFSWP